VRDQVDAEVRAARERLGAAGKVDDRMGLDAPGGERRTNPR